jgi:hypothetical protein
MLLLCDRHSSCYRCRFPLVLAQNRPRSVFSFRFTEICRIYIGWGSQNSYRLRQKAKILPEPILSGRIEPRTEVEPYRCQPWRRQIRSREIHLLYQIQDPHQLLVCQSSHMTNLRICDSEEAQATDCSINTKLLLAARYVTKSNPRRLMSERSEANYPEGFVLPATLEKSATFFRHVLRRLLSRLYSVSLPSLHHPSNPRRLMSFE